MRTYPIAGQLLEQKFLFGISIRDLADVFSIPFIFMGVTAFAGFSDVFYVWLGGLGLLLSFIILFKTPPAQRPRHWIRAYVVYHLGTNTYLNRPVERERDPGMIQDVVLTYGEERPSDESADA